MAPKRRASVRSPRWYDFYDDWDLIESSIAQQYGIRLRSEIERISWSEVSMLISGLLPDTPLGRVIQIRSENDKEQLKHFTPEMKKIRNDWRNRLASDKLKDEDALNRTFDNMEKMLKVLFYDNK
jgi:hypothetical protein